MFYVNMARLLQALSNRGLTYSRNTDGTVTINGEIFDREGDVEIYLELIPRTDI